ncbi:Werner Syndrome-like exonuclease [Sesbania bispinosa]|nr:Werner Syndrome-like exonuclease [Sesbania bispinosa]
MQTQRAVVRSRRIHEELPDPSSFYNNSSFDSVNLLEKEKVSPDSISSEASLCLSNALERDLQRECESGWNGTRATTAPHRATRVATMAAGITCAYSLIFQIIHAPFLPNSLISNANKHLCPSSMSISQATSRSFSKTTPFVSPISLTFAPSNEGLG